MTVQWVRCFKLIMKTCHSNKAPSPPPPKKKGGVDFPFSTDATIGKSSVAVFVKRCFFTFHFQYTSKYECLYSHRGIKCVKLHWVNASATIECL